jgi:hypothetical protein
LYSINQKLADMEQVSSQQFGVSKSTLRKLITALDGQSQGLFASTKMILGLLLNQLTKVDSYPDNRTNNVP